ncbi:N-acetylglucosamine kinase [Pseudarthrobacter sp. J1763]|uniref:N-acetylglucosamine kinase n=1 Tax=Pseudarthrobacter sp. J1763 TaxID=3420445 RepID=UPI003D29838A
MDHFAPKGPARMVLAADIGKSKCRLELRENHVVGAKVLGTAEAPGFAGLATEGGSRKAFELIADAATHLPVHGAVSVGAAVAGVAADTAGGQRLATELAAHFRGDVTVLSDATAAQLGAFGSNPGTVLIVGTGAVAFRFDGAGELHRADGWGPFLGDRGSGRWIGQAGLSAVLEAYDAGPATTLTAASTAMVRSPELLPSWLGSFENPSRPLASFAPAVVAAAENKDVVAAKIIDQACKYLAESVRRAGASGTSSVSGTISDSRTTSSSDASSGTATVSVLGGLASSPYFARTLAAALTQNGFAVVEPVGTGLDGAALAAGPGPLLQERHLYRESAR